MLRPRFPRERSGISDELLIDLDVVVGHALSGKSLIEHFPASMPVNGPELLHLAHHFIKILADKTRLTMTDDFRDRTPAVSEDRCTTGQALNQHEAERFRPIVGTDQSDGIPDKIAFFPGL